MLNLGNDFDREVLTAAGVDPDAVQQGTLSIDFIPVTGPTTVRYRMVGTVDATELRAIIAKAAGDAGLGG